MTTGEADAGEAQVGISGNALILFSAFLTLGGAVAAMAHPPGVLVFLFVVAGWLVSMVLHEFGHAFVAWKAGDTSVVGRGYLTLDPLKYGDLQVSLIVPLLALLMGGIGFPGGAVYLRPDLMRSRLGRSLSSLAGPAGTLAMLLAIAAAMPLLRGSALYGPLAFLAFLQATALVLNLLPVPGLDGYGVLRPFLPEAVTKAMRPVERGALLILLLAIFFVPGVMDSLMFAAVRLCQGLGVPPTAIGEGWDAFEFWKSAVDG